MFQMKEIKRLSPLFLFWGLYTLLFFLWVKTFFYTLPFLLGLIIAVVIRPAVSFLNERFRWNPTLSAAAVTAVSLAALFSALVFLGVFAVREVTSFIIRASENGFAEFSQPVSDFLNRIGGYLQRFNLAFLEQNKKEIMDLLQNGMELILKFLGTAVSLVTSLPTGAAMLIVIVFTVFFISRDMEKLRSWVKQVLSPNAVFHVKSAAENSGDVGRKYLLSYLFLYFITFCEAYVVFAMLGLSYPLTTALVTAAADILPVLGPGFVFLPLAAYQLLLGEYPRAAGLLIGWGAISLIRQIVEPRLVSSTVKVHPLSMLAAIYFSLVGKNIWILFYVMGFFSLYAAFRETGALPSLTDRKESKKKTAGSDP